MLCCVFCCALLRFVVLNGVVVVGVTLCVVCCVYVLCIVCCVYTG